MVCQICAKKTATVHLTEIINDQMTELHLCEDCAKEKGIAGLGQPFGLQDLLAGLVDFGAQVTPDKKTVTQCPNCKMSYEDFRKIGRLGCSQCYDTFKKTLEPLLKKIHGSVQHLGKAPLHEHAADTPAFKSKKDLQQMKLKLQKAIEAEEFEQAAQIRDKIKQLEKENK